jgi:mannitol/fructose-specific phosphotransferase system IIA component (Ntr-type)
MNNSLPGRLALNELLSPEAIKLCLTGSKSDETLAELVDQIQEIADQPKARQTLLRALQKREQLQPTNLGNGIALPHAHNALVGLVDHPVVVFGRHDEGIAYGNIDDVPARLFFLLLAPSVTQHLALVARTNRILRDPRLRQGLLIAESPETVIGLIRDAESEL